MGSLGDELSLGSMPKTISSGSSRNVSKCMNVKKLEEEKRKIESCELELPLCLQILNDAILFLKEENKRLDTQPLLNDFFSLNKPFREEEEEEEEEDKEVREGDGIDMQLLKREELIRGKKFQQWEANDHISNQSFSDTKIKNKLEIERNEEKSSDGIGMLFIPDMRTPKVETGLGLCLNSSSIVNGGRRKETASSCGFTSNSMPQPPPFLQQQALRKQRRCWTPELHRRFVDALKQLGGPGVATPKQIREHMQEEGLTNDEVKSHLQKYRLHIRKPNPNPEKQSGVGLGFKLWNSSQAKETCNEGEESSSSKRSDSVSDSPQGPLQLPCTTTTTGGESSMEDESFEMEKC